jgi:hypothetical protein
MTDRSVSQALLVGTDLGDNLRKDVDPLRRDSAELRQEDLMDAIMSEED